jgi:hypothetical protein
MLAVSSPADAQRARGYDPYKWCAVYGGLFAGGGGTNCGFRTYRQCLATVSGVGGTCQPNPFYNPGRRHYRR